MTGANGMCDCEPPRIEIRLGEYVVNASLVKLIDARILEVLKPLNDRKPYNG